MADSQPGKVTTFDPSVSLENFSANSRDRFMFNENQLVLAKLQQPRSVLATAKSRSQDGTFTNFDNYKNLDGEYAYIDGSFQALDTTGVPTSDVHRVVIGFDRQVTTSGISFWSTSFVETDNVFVEYSFDNNTWFDAGSITWTQTFDDTIKIHPDDDPPTGEYRYDAAFSTGDITARYWRIRGDAQQDFISISGNNPSKTITVDSTDHFPDSGTLYATGGGSDVTITYTGKTSTTFTGVTETPEALAAGYVIFSLYAFGNGVTEVQILDSTDPILEHWNSDGTKAVSNLVEGSNYYDICYDKADDVYYAIRFDDTLSGSSITPDDDFDSATGSSFDTSRWVEDTTNSYFQHSNASGTLQLKSSGGDGQLSGNYGIDGDFKLDIELVAAELLSNEDAYFSLEAKDYESGNQYGLSAIRGTYDPPGTTTGNYVSATISYEDTVGGAAEIQDFRLKPEGTDFSLGTIEYTLTYNSSSDEYDVTVSGVSHPAAKPGVPYSLDSASFTVSNISTPSNGQSFDVTVKVAENAIADSTTSSGITLELERSGTNLYSRYEESDTPGFNTALIGNISSSATVRPQLYGSPGGASVDVSADNFDVTNGIVVFDTPVFSVVTLDKSGNLTQVAGVSDSSGYAIKRFDVIQDPQVEYNRYLAPRVAIATDGTDSGSGGEIYIKVDDTLYRYTKSSLQLDLEDGSTAATETTGQIPSTGITNFSYNGYSQAGLSYVEDDNSLGGVYVKSIDTSTLTSVSDKALLDIDSADYRFAWNVVDLATLYYVDGTDLKLFDLNESKAAFVTVTSDKQILSAGTSETATITGEVLNVYGDPKSNKSMTFTVSDGDGAISPATGCSDAQGKASTTYTVGSSVGTSTITISVSDTSC